MPYSEKLADRVRELISATHEISKEKKMFSGLCFMVDDKMCVGVQQNSIMVRFDPALQDEIMEMPGCTLMNFTGKTMIGYVFVTEDVLNTKKQLAYWIKLALDFNPKAKSSKNKK